MILESETETSVYYYRYENRLVSVGVDEFDNSLGSTMELYCHRYRLLKKTPKGAWINTYSGRRFVLDEARRKYAHPTQEAALHSFIARKDAQIRILDNRIEGAEQGKRLAQSALNKLHKDEGRASAIPVPNFDLNPYAA